MSMREVALEAVKVDENVAMWTIICRTTVCETAIWVAFLIFLKGLMRVIIISETRELILLVVELS